jgi:DNA-binding transcriptional regulator YiaG
MEHTPHFGDVIRRLRHRLHLTQEELARELDITVSTVNRWEQGHAKPSKLARLSLTRFAGLRGIDVAHPDEPRGARPAAD